MKKKRMRFSIEIEQFGDERDLDFRTRANKLLNKCIAKVACVVGKKGTVTITLDRKKKPADEQRNA